MSLIAGPNPGLGTWPARRARISPDRTALLDPRRSLTYAGLAERTARYAGALRRLGVGPGDRVAYLGVNAVEVFETFFAAWLLGAIAVPLNYRLSGAEVRYMLDDGGASVLVHSADTDALVAATALPAGLQVLAVHPTSCPAGGLDYEAEIAHGPALGAEPPVGLDDPAIILYTSGTTGRPKGAVLTHGNLTWNTINYLAHVDVLSTDRALCIAPLFHCVGLSQLTLPTLFKGGSVELVAKADPGLVLERVSAARITGFSAVPTMLQMMCEHPAWDSADLSSLILVQYGGSPVQERVARAWLGRGVRLLQGYGMTEASPGVYMSTHDGTPAHPTAVGVPHFFTDVALLRDGRPEPVGGEPAELVVRGPHVFTGYWNRPEETAASFVDGRWFRSGDVLRVDGDGWAHVVDRVKDVYISGGENVYPAEVEAVAVALDDVADCAVVGVADRQWGEVGVGYVQLRDGATLAEAELRAHLEANLARYKVPKHLEFVPELPRNPTGKIRRVDLRRRAADEHPIEQAAGSPRPEGAS
ncbi:long-chain fatty acid--CoA ligase [Pseudonocardia sp. K10HN5]|uniref:Long-chain fatty acid--CoA ligase n=2 Tax=Pseudonocardia acidicola TaxID=2724939 RepID=A0ABX1SC97_9PSEU|nr:long-chain fatty acid--CoA ligase [Pseudonocardia acidicola]NMH98437.1 long-chain fatty acid--CoA ligase [Pseudonocardia acidicola]